jgi:hypothetical protein
MTRLKSVILKKTFSLYVYYATILLGWQGVAFIFIYSSMDETDILHHLAQVAIYQPYLIGMAVFLTGLLVLFKILADPETTGLEAEITKQLRLQSLFVLVLLINHLLYLSDAHFHFFELIIFIAVFWLLKKWGSLFYNSNNPVWQNPTTHGTFFVSAMISGCALLDIFNLVHIEDSALKYVILILLGFDLLILYTRFQYLAKYNHQTNWIARKLMSTQILYFGMRIIVGIFVPALFILYVILIKQGGMDGIGVLLLIGTLLERYIFIETGESRNNLAKK